MSLLLSALMLAAALVDMPARASQPVDVFIRAADLRQAQLNGAWTLASDASSPGGLKLTASTGENLALDAPVTEPASYFDVSFHAEAHVPYRLWIRLAPGAEPSRGRSIWVQFSDAEVAAVPAYAIGTRDGLLVAVDGCADAAWSWSGSSERLAQRPFVTFPSGGWHRLRVQVGDGSIQVDQIVLSPQTYLNGPPDPVQADRTTVARRDHVEAEWRESR